MKPGFLFVGPTKSGTTWIDAYLRERGDVSLPVQTKETFFFDKVFDKGADWYFSLFDRGPDKKICVEVAPSLFHKPEAARRAAEVLGDALIICTVRNPIDRAVSHYFHYRKEGEPRRKLADMVRHKPDIISPGLYSRNLQYWQDAFGADRVVCLFYDDLRLEPLKFCAELCRVLGLPYIPPSEAILHTAINEAGVPRNRVVARLVRRATEAVRFAGGHAIVNALKGDRLKSLVFGGGGQFEEERKAIRQEAETLLPYFEADASRFETQVGRSPLSAKR